MDAFTLAGLAAIGSGTAGGILGWSAMAPSAQLFGPTLRRMGDSLTLALTFDDGPNPRVTPKLLDLLGRCRTRATFFLIGEHVRAFPEIAKEIAARGHQIGNHTQTHPNLLFRSPSAIERELMDCQRTIEEACAVKATWMRPPFGFRGPQLNRVVRRLGFRGVAMWSVWAWDWKPQPAERVADRLRRVRAGDIVLLHDGDPRTLEGDRLHTLAALEEWLPRWIEEDFRFVTLDECRSEG